MPITETFKYDTNWVTRLDQSDKNYPKFKYVSGIGDTPEEAREEFHIAYDFAQELEEEKSNAEND